MNQLAKLQNTFQDAVLQPDKNNSVRWVSAKGRVTAETQISIYSYAYHARLIEVLANDYPAILMAIGDEKFTQLASNYIAKHPSHYFSLRDFGCDFANFILKSYPQADMRWLYELAIFEWSLGQAFDVADVCIFKEKDMATIPAEKWPELKFVLHPSVQRLNFKWNTVEMWQTLTSEEPGEVTPHEEESPWLIWREQLSTQFRSMQSDEQLAFDVLQAGGSFTDICEALATIMNENEVPIHAASLLKSWIAQNLIHNIQ